MKDWLPLASYEFYGVPTAGMIALAVFDRVLMGSALHLSNTGRLCLACSGQLSHSLQARSLPCLQ